MEFSALPKKAILTNELFRKKDTVPAINDSNVIQRNERDEMTITRE
jgi:hypothetical protein